MNRQLRKRHRIIWSLLALIVPMLLLMSWLLIPQLEPVKAINISHPESLPVLLKTIKRTQYEAEIRTNSKGDLQIEWWNKKALQVPSAVIYQIKENEQQVLIGRIEARGTYRFPLHRDSTSKEYHLQLYDFIHEQVIDTINFSL